GPALALCHPYPAPLPHERHGRGADVDSARPGGARICTHPRGRHRRARAHGLAPGGTPRRGRAMILALAVVPVALLLLGFPIFMVLLTGVTVALVFYMHVPLVVLHQTLFGSINAFALLAIPFFIYAGELM